MRCVVGLLCVAACATKPASPPHNVAASTVTKPEERTLARTQAAPHESAPTKAAFARRDRDHVDKLTPEIVLATIRGRYIAGVERCYRRHLKRNAGARGHVLVSFTVDPHGRARDGEARGITDRVDDCIAAQVRRWRFPIAKQRSESRFALGLELGGG